MHTNIQRWGNSLGLRIPKSFAAEVGIEDGSVVDLALENGDLIVRPVSRVTYDLSRLVRAINVKNMHEAVETGSPSGEEAW